MHSKTFGLFAGNAGDPYTRSIIVDGMSRALLEQHHGFTAVASRGGLVDKLCDPASLARFAGVAYWPARLPDLLLLRQIRKSVPIVIVDCPIRGFEVDFVGFRDFEAGYEAAQHLYQLGHRRIAFLGSVVPQNPEVRCMGVDAFCRDAGVERAWNFAEFSTDYYVPEEFIKSLLGQARATWPTAAVCANDETAAFLFSVLSRVSIRIPDDLALVGFGNSQPSLLEALGLTTMAQPYEDMGATVVKLLSRRLTGPNFSDVEEVRLPMSLVIRSSCGASQKNLPSDI